MARQHHGGRVVGFAGYGDAPDDGGAGAGAGNAGSGAPDGDIFALYVLAEYYGRGVGRALTDEAIRLLGGRRRVRLEVLADNARAIRFYEKYGFRRSGRSRTVNLGAPLTAIEMVLEAK